MDIITLAAAKRYTDETIKGEGAIKGKDGDSAYQVAVKNGFSGTEAEWLESLKGKDGTTSIDDSKIAEDSTYSSQKIEEDLAKKVDTEIVTGYVNLDTGADLNTLVTYGTFRTTTKRIDRIDNVPVQVAGMLEVRLTGGVIYQTYKTIDDEMYIRSSEDTGVTWADWKKVATTDDLSEYVAIQQKVEDKGKALVVGADGKLILEEVATSDIGSVELNMLGWNVPSELSLKNEVVGNKFIQKIARVDLGTLDWQYRSSDGLMLCQTPLESKAIAETDAPNIYCSAYKSLPRSGTESVANTDKSIALPNRYTIVHDSGYTDGTAYKTAIKGIYLYYELATPIEKVIEENEIISQLINSNGDELEVTELKMLGWNVPKECTIKNEVNGNQFVQKVGRVDLGSLGWGLSDADRYIFRNSLTEIDNIRPYEDIYAIPNAYIYGYIPFGYGPLSANDDLHFAISNTADNRLVVINHKYNSVSSFKSAMKGKYLYYELATPITTQIDGNEVIEKDAVTAKVNNFVKPTSNAEILALSNGIYSINVDDTSLFPCRWGTLIVLKSGYVYGSMIFIGTDASYWFRNISSGAWRETWWQKLTVADWQMMAETKDSNTMEFPLANLPSGIFFQGVLTNNTGEYGADYVSFCKDQTNGISVITPFKDTDRAISYVSSTKTIKVTGTGYYRRFSVKAM